MNIVMMTNTYKPILGGLERSIEILSAELRGQGNNVLIVVPCMGSSSSRDPGVFRVPAIARYRKTEFPLQLPVPSRLSSVLEAFAPDVIHSHHPFLIGDTAMRAAARFGVPLVFTMHTMYERYTHYLPLDSVSLKRFIIHLSTGYANLCDHVLAPSRSVAQILARRGVVTPVSVVPSGIPAAEFSPDRGREFRLRRGIPAGAFVVGFVSRIAREKNIDFLLQSVGRFMSACPGAYFLSIGTGPMAARMADFFGRAGMRKRFRAAGALRGAELVNAYHAMNVFAFSSLSETQGLVLAESMAAGVPVVAVDAPGTRDIVRDGRNGRLVRREDAEEFSAALSWVRALDGKARRDVQEACRATARDFSSRHTACRILAIYRGLARKAGPGRRRGGALARASHLIKAEWMLMLNMIRAAGQAVFEKNAPGQ